MKKGVRSVGITAPIIREGDNIPKIVAENVLKEVMKPNGVLDIDDKSVVGITESIVARAQGNYVTVDEIADEIISKYGKRVIIAYNPIYSRNRFAIILKALARASNGMVYVVTPNYDEVGNPFGYNQFTGVDIADYYKEIIESEGCEVGMRPDFGKDVLPLDDDRYLIVDCRLHNDKKWTSTNTITLKDICSDKCEYGLLGSNKATEEKLKLFPKKEETQVLVEETKAFLKKYTGKDIIVCVYGDGCFKDPVGGIWEFADPITMPSYTDPEIIESTPNEVKVKALADDKFANLNGEELQNAMENEIANKEKNLVGSMQSQGTTPRLYRDLLASLMDLTSGSGDRCTPIVLIRNYF